MARCTECAQLLAPEATKCPSCGHDLHPRPLPPERRTERDEEQDADELLAAAIATEGTSTPPPAWAGSDDERPPTPVAPPPRPAPDEEIRDVVPEPEKKSFWRRLRG
jgi:hypothetical protein